MAINPISAVGPSAASGGVGAAPKVKFSDVAAPKGLSPQSLAPKQVAASGKVAAGGISRAGSTPSSSSTVATNMLNRVESAQARMDHILKLAQSGKTFSAAELLSLQTHAYSASQELDLAGKVVEKGTGGIKQVLQTQV